MPALPPGTTLFALSDLKHPLGVSVGVQSAAIGLIVMGHASGLYGDLGLVALLIGSQVVFAIAFRLVFLYYVQRVDSERRVHKCPVKDYCQPLISMEQKSERLRSQVHEERLLVRRALEESSAKEVRRLLLEVQQHNEKHGQV